MDSSEIKHSAVEALMGVTEGRKMAAFVPAVKKEFLSQNFGFKCEHPESFVLCQWQRSGKPSVWYLMYRLTMVVYFATSLILCLFNVGRSQREHVSLPKWPVYLTNWGLTVYTLQAVIGSALLFQQLRDERHSGNGGAKKPPCEMSCWTRLYWLLHTIAVSVGFAITGSYWCLVYNPEKHALDVISILAHVVNSIAMGIDLCLVRHPFRLLHFHWPLSFLTVYYSFTFVYYLLGGTDPFGDHRIYSILDWQRPLQSFLTCFNSLVYVFCTHIIVWVLFLGRRWTFNKFVQAKPRLTKESVFLRDGV